MKKTLAIIAIIMLASLSVLGCVGNTNTTSSSPTSAPNVDYSSYYTSAWQDKAGFIVTQPFIKSSDGRGNDVYVGIVKNATLTNAIPMTVVVELTKSEAQAKQVFDSFVAAKLNAGFSVRSDQVAALNADPSIRYDGIWVGQSGGLYFGTFYRYNSAVNSWEVTTESGVS